MGKDRMVLRSCLDCGNQRLVRAKPDGTPYNLRCWSCANKGKGGNGGIMRQDGYVYHAVTSSDFFFPMAIKKYSKETGYVMEHRLIMAKHLGRCLCNWELVHHKNHIRDDNRIENLQLVSDERHQQITIMENKIRRLESKMEAQEKEIRLLNWLLQEKKEVGAR